MDKKFIKVPLVLTLICVGSAALISGVHALTSLVPVSKDAPEEMKALYPNATFEALDGFCSYKRKDDGMLSKVTVSSCFSVKENGSEVAYAYDIKGATVSGDLSVYVTFEAPVTSSTVASDINPAKVKLYECPGSYVKGPNALIDALNGGSDLDDTFIEGTGSTKAENSTKDNILAARNDYIERKQGKKPGNCDVGPAPATPTTAEGFLQQKYSSATIVKDESYAGHEETTGAGYNIKVLERFTVKNGETEVAVGYHTSGAIPDEEGETMDLVVSFEGTCADTDEAKKAFKPAYVMAIDGHQDYATVDTLRDYAADINSGKVDVTTNPNSEIVAGTVLTGATHTAKLFYFEVNRARADYLTTHLA